MPWTIARWPRIVNAVPFVMSARVGCARSGEIENAANSTVRRVITLQQGIPSDAAREIIKYIKDQKLKKVQATIQGDQLRISSPSKDELQDAIRILRDHDFGIALQFGNYR